MVAGGLEFKRGKRLKTISGDLAIEWALTGQAPKKGAPYQKLKPQSCFYFDLSSGQSCLHEEQVIGAATDVDIMSRTVMTPFAAEHQ